MYSLMIRNEEIPAAAGMTSVKESGMTNNREKGVN